MGGTFCGCLHDTRGDKEFTVQINNKDLPSIIVLQNVVRGYMERRKIVGLTKLRFQKGTDRRQKRGNNVVINKKKTAAA